MTKYQMFMAAAAVAPFLLPAQAEDCGNLFSHGTIPLIHIDNHASEFIPVEINGVPKLMMVDTGAQVTTITSKTASELNLTTAPAGGGVYDVTGSKSAQLTAASLKVASLKSDRIVFMLGTPYLDELGNSRVAGLLGGDILNKFDISLDYGAHTFAMFDQNHCDGQVIYWPERPVAIIPFRLVGNTEIVFTVTLDGHEVKAQLDTGASQSTLEKSRAEGRFGLTLGSPDTPAIEHEAALPLWMHRFKTLSLAGLEVNNPEIMIIPDKMGESMNDWHTGTLLERQAHGDTDRPAMLLGMNVLKQLRIYIAYKEKKLYISPASKPAAPTTAAPVKAN